MNSQEEAYKEIGKALGVIIGTWTACGAAYAAYYLFHLNTSWQATFGL